MNIIDIIPVSRGDNPADVLLKNCRIVNVFSGEIEKGNIALFKKRIAGIGDYDEGREVIDLEGAYIVPGLIDAHLHIESSMVSPVEFAKTILARGTTTAIADPHEIANVMGLSGIEYMIRSTEGIPVNLYIMIPSAVPASSMETSGARISAMDMIGFVEKFQNRILGLGEVMNFPDIINGDRDSIAKIELIRHKYKKIDGHIPGVLGKPLNAYISAFVRSEHECTFVEEAREKLSRGMQILMREGSVERNLVQLLPLINDKTYPFVSFCTDDKHPVDIIREGHIDHNVRLAIEHGIDPIIAIRAATINTARHYNLRSMGAIAPGYKADLVVVDNLRDFNPIMVFKDSKIVARNGRLVTEIVSQNFPQEKVNTFKCQKINEKDLELPAEGRFVRAIELLGSEVLTGGCVMDAKIENGMAVGNLSKDLLKVAAICRYCEGKSMSVAFATGSGLKKGAVATSVGHDSHNLGVLGTNDSDMVTAANRVMEMGGGLVAVIDGKIVSELPLRIAGLMSEMTSKEVAERLVELKEATKTMGSKLPDLFMTLSFMQLSVIPKLKLTNLGLVDVEKNDFVSLFVKEGQDV
ncbi:MAG TPA: adenine deaminase [Mesotoga infera]|jgi:adenine deaminase|nr:adenine deaminase [Mesotoga sp.]NLI06846.1 adenine deaminase [Thermotogaceae bacterium]HOI34291.1 adenine deaminase [Mesotoga infera]HON26862.1 adenine deaminase [Mesotoga infera]HPD38708.1 adenine deaminase [Mesotoga infera]